MGSFRSAAQLCADCGRAILKSICSRSCEMQKLLCHSSVIQSGSLFLPSSGTRETRKCSLKIVLQLLSSIPTLEDIEKCVGICCPKVDIFHSENHSAKNTNYLSTCPVSDLTSGLALSILC